MSASPTIAGLRRLWALGRPALPDLVRSFACMVALGLTTGAFAWLSGPALRFLLSGGHEGLGALGALGPLVRKLSPDDARLALPLALLAVAAVRALAYLGQFYWVGLYAQRVVVRLRRQIFDALLALTPTEATRRSHGDLLARLGADVVAVESAAHIAVAAWLRDSVQLVVLLGVCFGLSWKFTLLALGAIPLAVLPAARLSRSVFRRVRAGQASVGALAGQVHEALGAARALQAFGAGPRALRTFAAGGERLRADLTAAAWRRAAVPAVMEVLGATGVALALGVAAGTAGLEPERLVSFVAALVLLYQPAKDLGRVGQFAVAAAAALERIDTLLGLRAVPPAPDRPPRAPASLQLEQVHFAWGERPALRGLDLELPRGELTALVGPSGSGKSTVVSLLLGLEAPSSGRVLVDGRPATAVGETALRGRCALVTQEPLLFSATVRDNLLVGKPDATDDELDRALRAAGASEFVAALPQGLETRLAERGLSLSGGQRQRLCLARALLSEAQVLVLDEPTSSLDPESAREVQQALETALRGRTALLVTHQLGLARSAHRVHVLDGGQVVESGSHDALLARQGLYASLWSREAAAAQR